MRLSVPVLMTTLSSRAQPKYMGAVRPTTTDISNSMTPFVAKYLDRIGVPQGDFDSSETLNYDLFCRLTEAHLSSIPFENLAQHGGHGGPVTLNLDDIADKILDRQRGGFCMELNGLFATLLDQLGCQTVLVPAIVYGDEQVGFNRPSSHVTIIARLPNDQGTYFVDVGFGEPPSNPLKYEFGSEQVTSEGMKSRLVENDGIVTLEWYKGDSWKPRLRWMLEDSLAKTSRTLSDFQPTLDLVQSEASIFSNKLIVCRLTLDSKVTLAGSKFKVTGPPRFVDHQQGEVTVTHFATLEEARDILATHFGIPLQETEQLAWGQITAQDPKLFEQF